MGAKQRVPYSLQLQPRSRMKTNRETPGRNVARADSEIEDSVVAGYGKDQNPQATDFVAEMVLDKWREKKADGDVHRQASPTQSNIVQGPGFQTHSGLSDFCQAGARAGWIARSCSQQDFSGCHKVLPMSRLQHGRSWAVSDSVKCYLPIEYAADSTPVLAGKEAIWVVASPVGADSWVVWNDNSIGRLCLLAQSVNGVWHP